MAKRYSGNLQISVVYDDKGHYRTSVSSGGKRLWRGVVNPAPAGFGPARTEEGLPRTARPPDAPRSSPG